MSNETQPHELEGYDDDATPVNPDHMLADDPTTAPQDDESDDETTTESPGDTDARRAE